MVVLKRYEEKDIYYRLLKAISIQTLAEGETLGQLSLAATKRATQDYTKAYHPGNTTQLLYLT